MSESQKKHRKESVRMRKSMFTVLAVIVAFLSILAACGKDTQPQQESIQTTTEEATQTTTEKAMQTTTVKASQKELTVWGKAYKELIDNTLKEYKEKYPDETNYGGYGLYDFDKDSIPELFLKTGDSAMSDGYIHIYDFDGDKAVPVGSIESAHLWVYGTDKENSFLTEYFWMGESVWNIYVLENGEFVSEKLGFYYPDGFGDSIEPQENPLPGMGYEVIEIEYFNTEDTSGLMNYPEQTINK